MVPLLDVECPHAKYILEDAKAPGTIQISMEAPAEVMIQWDPLACMAFVSVLPSVIQLQHWFAARLMRIAQLLSLPS